MYNRRIILLGLFVTAFLFLCLEWSTLSPPPQQGEQEGEREEEEEEEEEPEKEHRHKKEGKKKKKTRYVFIDEASMEKEDRREGINIQKQNAVEVLLGAYTMYKKYGYTVIIPPFTTGIGVPLDPKVFFEDIIDYEAVLKMFNIGPFFVTRIPEGLQEIRLAPYWSERRNKDHYIISWKELSRMGQRHNPELQNDMLKALLIFPSQAILEKANYLTEQLDKKTRGQPYTCLHMRTEYDFKDFFHGPPGYYSVSQVVSKVCAGFPELKSVLYITGDHTNLDPIRKKFSACSSSFSLITSKLELAGNRTDMFLSNKNFLSTIDAEVDRIMCARADSFVGNNHSSWSELLQDYLLWVGRSPDSIRQVNDVSPGVRDKLFPFCAANAMQRHHVDCFYYRL